VKVEINGGMKNIFNSYQNDFDSGIGRDPGYIYGPLSPRMIYLGLKFGSFL
jgi:outer membrane receptor for ferrienterochelin and colicins